MIFQAQQLLSVLLETSHFRQSSPGAVVLLLLL
jgi:hypothetical protein